MNTRHEHAYAITAIVLLVIFLGWLCFLLVQTYTTAHLFSTQDNSGRMFRSVQDVRKPLTIKNVVDIAPWMTFDFINHVFNVPPTYLSNAFNITDANYPRMSLRSYASLHGIDEQTFLVDVQKKVADYLNSLPSHS